MRTPLVTIIALNYNNADFVLETLDSIKSQTYVNIELIIIDDFSQDNSVSIIDQWISVSDKTVKFIRHDKNIGLCAACNSGAEAAKGKYISLIATDDIMFPSRIEMQVNLFENSSEDTGAVFSDMNLIDIDSKVIGKSYFEKIGVNSEEINDIINSDSIYQISRIIDRNFVPAPAVMYRLAHIKNLGLWNNKLYFEDLYMNLNLLKNGYKFVFNNEILTSYRYFDSSMSRKPNPKFWESYLFIIDKYRGMSLDLDNIINRYIMNYAEMIYKYDGKSFRWLKKSFSILKRKKTFLFLIFSLLGIKYEQFNRITNKFKIFLSHK